MIKHSKNVIVKADPYAHVMTNDGYVIFMDDAIVPKNLYCYNAHKQESYALPNINQFIDQDINFGKVMLPIHNGILLTYPNKKSDAIVFVLNKRKQFIMKDKEATIQTLNRNYFIQTSMRN